MKMSITLYYNYIAQEEEWRVEVDIQLKALKIIHLIR